MQRDAAYLRDIQESARLALAYLEGVDMEAFAGNTQLQDAVIRRVEIIGEAARFRSNPRPVPCATMATDDRHAQPGDPHVRRRRRCRRL